MDVLSASAALTGVLAAGFFDWKLRRIPNWITGVMMCFGLLINTWANGSEGFTYSAFGLVSGILLLYIPFACHGMGGGDVKLLGALGSILGPGLVFKIFLVSALFGGLFSLVVMARNRAMNQTLKRLGGMAWNRLLYFLATGKILAEPGEMLGDNRLTIPYAFAIGCGTMFVLFLL